MGWLRLVGSLKLLVAFAKEPYKRDYILQKRLMILRSLLVEATPYHTSSSMAECAVYVGRGGYPTSRESTQLTPYTKKCHVLVSKRLILELDFVGWRSCTHARALKFSPAYTISARGMCICVRERGGEIVCVVLCCVCGCVVLCCVWVVLKSSSRHGCVCVSEGEFVCVCVHAAQLE